MNSGIQARFQNAWARWEAGEVPSRPGREWGSPCFFPLTQGLHSRLCWAVSQAEAWVPQSRLLTTETNVKCTGNWRYQVERNSKQLQGGICAPPPRRGRDLLMCARKDREEKNDLTRFCPPPAAHSSLCILHLLQSFRAGWHTCTCMHTRTHTPADLRQVCVCMHKKVSPFHSLSSGWGKRESCHHCLSLEGSVCWGS